MLKRGKVKNNVFLGIAYTLILIIFILFLSGFASASFTLGNKSNEININYGLNEKISGWINISIANEDYNSQFSDNFNNRIGLIEFLNKYYPRNYSCLPSDCAGIYVSSSNGASSNKIVFGSGNNEKLIGVKLDGNDVEVTRFSLALSSNAQESCDSQLNIDFLDNNESNWGNKKAILENCGGDAKSSCYPPPSSSFPEEWFAISTETYCENITLPKSPAFEVKAVIKKDSDASPGFSPGLLRASIYNSKREFVGECNLTQPATTASTQNCIINYVAKQRENHFVCIAANIGDNAEIKGYKLQGKSTAPFCGFLGEPASTSGFSKDYNIIVSAKKFDSVGNFIINEATYSEQNSEDIITMLNNYLINRYRKDCSSANGCIVPIKIVGLQQEININNLNLEYTSLGSAGTQTTTIYNVSKTLSKINSGFIKINLSLMNLSIPLSAGNKSWNFYLSNQKILDKNITVIGMEEKVIWKVYPTDVAVATLATFTAFVDPAINISGMSYSWDFGDGSGPQITQTNKIKHTYSEVRNYTLKVRLLNGGNELGSSSFKISAQSPKQAINITIKDYQRKISTIESQINALSQAYKDIIKEGGFDFDAVKTQLSTLDTSYRQALLSATTSDQDYINIMNELNKLEMPQAIRSSATSQIKFINDVNELDLSKANELFDEKYDTDEEESYRNAINSWFLDNIDAKANHKIISVYYDTRTEDVVSEFILEIKPKNSEKELNEIYVMINANSDKILFDGDYDILDSDEATGIKIGPNVMNGKTIKFAIKGSVDVFQLPIFILPKSGDLSIETGIISNLKPKSFLARFLIGSIITLILALIIYIILQEWYKKNYEKSLFKDKNRLYNLLYFISNAKRQNLSDDEIKKRLRSQWKGEQIIYAIKKFEGKRVGMWEIPVFRKREQKKMQQEIMKRGPRRVF
ncbi:PKD domain-containing protein [Candidatus Pacearchaeota archaeon]|nr:PKD domain-containing protein [Candidatus Pacearchaeota archaeon]